MNVQKKNWLDRNCASGNNRNWNERKISKTNDLTEIKREKKTI